MSDKVKYKIIKGNNKEIGNKKVIDLIVPMYKAKDTLIRLLGSVTSQTMRENINVILVQDCDGEDYSEIISIFEKVLSIKTVALDKNQGPGSCRRIGTNKGKCKYIMYMDSDDTLQNPFAVEELYRAIESNKLDAVNSIFFEQVGETNFLPHDNNDWIWMFGKIYRRSFLEKNKIEMNDSRANEDTGFNSVVKCVGNVGFLADSTYIWHYKEDSITRKDGGIYRFTGIEGWLYNMEWAIENILRINPEKEKIQQFVADNIISTYCWFLEFEDDKDDRVDIEEYKKWVNKYYNNIYCKYPPSKEQLNNSFSCQSNNFASLQKIPKYTFEQYLKMVGEDYGK